MKHLPNYFRPTLAFMRIAGFKIAPLSVDADFRILSAGQDILMF